MIFSLITRISLINHTYFYTQFRILTETSSIPGEPPVLVCAAFCVERHAQRLLEAGTVLFVDATYKTNDIGMPLFVAYVVDANNKVRPVGYAFAISESPQYQRFFLKSIVEMTGIDPGHVKTFFADGAFNPDLVKEILPEATCLRCCFHIASFNLKKKLVGSPYKDEAISFFRERLMEAKSEEAFNDAMVELNGLFNESTRR